MSDNWRQIEFEWFQLLLLCWRPLYFVWWMSGCVQWMCLQDQNRNEFRIRFEAISLSFSCEILALQQKEIVHFHSSFLFFAYLGIHWYCELDLFGRMNGCICLPSLTAPHLNFSITYTTAALNSKMEITIICGRGFRSQTTQILMISRCYFA